MKGDMQRWTPNVASIIEHAKELHPTTEIVSRMISGEIHRTTAVSEDALDEDDALGLALHIEDCSLILDSKTREAVKRVHAKTVEALKSPDRDESVRDNLLQIEHTIFAALFPSMSAHEQFKALLGRPPQA